ncbi:MAG: C69 family dipeptidase [Eubacteriales bacterium]|nr:C69 family dipeptidase [Eubacteriales bacterium]
MPCTTILVGKKASYDGSTIVARNEDCGAGEFCPKHYLVMHPEDQPRHYKSVLSHVEIDLPDNPMRYTYIPNALPHEGIWGAHGINEANVGMSATETITSNERVGGADPYVTYIAAKGKEGDPDYQPGRPGGIGEEDFVTLILPYIHSAREGVERMGMLLETYGTYERNGVAFQDADEIWWIETIGGHHWMARRVPDDCYATIPNQLGLDFFDFDDAYGAKENFLCSPDLKEFVEKYHLDLTLEGDFNPRQAFGSHTSMDHVYNTPRAWAMQRYFNPRTYLWDGPDADYLPTDDDIPWCQAPEAKITIEDVKEVLSNRFEGTPYDMYGNSPKKPFRPIGINRTSHLAILQIRPYVDEAHRAIQWITYASNVFNAITPYYANVNRTPEYLAFTPDKVDTNSYYWANRLIGALADSQFKISAQELDRYKLMVQTKAHRFLIESDQAISQADDKSAACEAADAKMADMLRNETDRILAKVLDIASSHMSNSFSRSDA